MEWYRIDIQEALARAESSEEGLSEQEARRRLEKYGPNKLAEGDKWLRRRSSSHA
jgi:magnesium-transporting ATPase (P-type)